LPEVGVATIGEPEGAEVAGGGTPQAERRERRKLALSRVEGRIQRVRFIVIFFFKTVGFDMSETLRALYLTNELFNNTIF
jgi:hypothetical protein